MLCSTYSSARIGPRLAGLLAVLCLGTAAALAQAAPVRVDAVEAELVADRAAIVPGEPLRLGLRLVHQPHWHTYWENPGDSGLPTEFVLSMPAGFAAGDIAWPAPQRIFIAPLANYGYEGEVLLARPVTVPDRLPGESVRFRAHASWLVCREVCVPGEADLELSLPIATAAGAGPGAHAALFDRMAARVPGPASALDYSLDDARLSIILPADLVGSAPSRVEYFALREGSIAHAAAQRLYRLADGRWRLEVPLAQTLRDASAAQAAAAVHGVFEIAGRAPLRSAPGHLRAIEHGELFAQVDGAPEPAQSLRGRAESLRDAAGLGAGAGLASVPSAPRIEPVAEAAGGLLGAATGVVRGLGTAMAFALVGGLILNLMPCVFPVIGLKILGFAGHGGAGESLDAAARTRVRTGALWFAAGVVVSFWILATVLLGLRAAGQAAGWGFQLQSPAFVFAMALLFVAIGLNLSGVYEIGAALTRLGAAESGIEHPVAGSFAAGALAVLVATPCTAPFMGSALGYTITQPPMQAMLVFTALGSGMAIPYVALGLFPGWLSHLPRPGRWMETLRQLLAFPMYGAAAWLAWVLGRQSGVDAMLSLALGAVAVAFALWLWGRFVQQSHRSRARPIALLAGFVALAIAAWLGWRSAQLPAPALAGMQPGWQTWSARDLAQARTRGRIVFVDFTAAWCVSCQVNKRLVLESDAIRQAFARRDVFMMQADWTRQDPAISAELARFGRNGVPLYLVYGPARESPVVLPELLSRDLVLDALAAVSRE